MRRYRPVQTAVVACLQQHGALRRNELAAVLGKPRHAVAKAVRHLVIDGSVVVADGFVRIAYLPEITVLAALSRSTPDTHAEVSHAARA